MLQNSNSRRAVCRLLTLGVVAAGSIGLPSCSRSGSPESGSPKAGSSIQKHRPLTVYAWTNYFSPQTLVAFTKETGIDVAYNVYPDPEEMEARLRSEPSTQDVIVIDSFNLRRLAQLGLLLPLDHAKLPQKKNLAKEFINMSFDPGNRYSIPHLWGTTLIAYRKDRIKDPELSWNLLWNENYRGKVMMIDEKFDPLATSLIRLGKSVEKFSPQDAADATAALVHQLQSVGAQYGSDQDVMEKLKSGEIWASMCYSGDAMEVASKESNVDFFIPVEGAPEWVDSYVIARDTPYADRAHQFINFMLRPEIAAQTSAETGYATANAAARPLIPASLTNDKRLYPPAEILERCHPLPPLDAEMERIVNRSWHEVQRFRADEAKRAAAQK